MNFNAAANTVRLNGKRFGRLLVVRKSRKRGRNYSCIWVCKCDCGRTKEILSHSLITGNTASCGCLRREMVSNRRKKASRHATGHIVWCNYKSRAKATKRVFEISEPEFRRLTSLNCVYCGSPPRCVRSRNNLNGDFLFNGLDRVDNSKGYTLNNVVPCCKQCNISKRGLTVEEFTAWIRRAYKHITEKVESPSES